MSEKLPSKQEVREKKFGIGETVYAKEPMDNSRVGRGSKGVIVSTDTIHDWRVKFMIDDKAVTLGVNEKEMALDKQALNDNDKKQPIYAEDIDEAYRQ